MASGAASQTREGGAPSPIGADRRWAWGGAAGLLVVGLLIQLPVFDRSIIPMDEGHLAAVATWLRQGKALYRDLHTGIFPGIYHLTEILFWIFGDDLVVARWAEVVTNLVITLCLWLTGLRLMRPLYAAVAPLLYLALVPVSFPVLAMFNYSSLSLGFSMLSLLFVVRLLDEGRRGDAIALGAVLALAVISKQNFGALAFLACLIATIAFRRGSALESRSIVATHLPIAAAGIAVTLCVLGYFVAIGTLMDLLHSTVIQLGGDQLDSFNNPIPPVLGPHPANDARFVFLYTPPWLFNTMLHQETILGIELGNAMHSLAIRFSYGIPLSALLCGGALAVQRLRANALERRRVILPVLFAGLFFLGIFPSAIWSHLAFILPPILLVIGLLLDRGDAAIARFSPWAGRGWQATATAGVAIAMAAGVQAAADVARWHPVPLELPRASLKVSPAQAQIYRAAMRFIDDCAPPGEAIFVAPDMPVLYFLGDRMNASRYDLTIPGDVDGHLIMVGLETNRTRCIVYNPVMYAEFPPFQQLFPDLFRYMRRNYRVERPLVGGGQRWQGLVRRTGFSKQSSQKGTTPLE